MQCFGMEVSVRCHLSVPDPVLPLPTSLYEVMRVDFVWCLGCVVIGHLLFPSIMNIFNWQNLSKMPNGENRNSFFLYTVDDSVIPIYKFFYHTFVTLSL